jgi:hypothetical protein
LQPVSVEFEPSFGLEQSVELLSVELELGPGFELSDEFELEFEFESESGRLVAMEQEQGVLDGIVVLEASVFRLPPPSDGGGVDIGGLASELLLFDGGGVENGQAKSDGRVVEGGMEEPLFVSVLLSENICLF